MIGRVFAVAALILAVACSRPGSWEEFVRAEDAVGGVYEFAPDMADGATTYDIALYTAPLAEPLQLEVTWLNTQAEVLSETVWFPAGMNSALYRSGIKVPTETSILIRVKPLNPPQDFRGLGIICEQNDGTR